jgi:hypothetical protein
MTRHLPEPLPAEESRWSRAYVFVLCFFGLEIFLLYLFSVRFS